MGAHVRRAAVAAWVTLVALATVDLVAASNVAAGLSDSGNVSVPTWLYALTGGAVIGTSGLLSMLVTDRELLDDLHEAGGVVREPRRLRGIGHAVGGALGVLGLVAIVLVGFLGPDVGQVNLAVLLVFVVGRAGLTIVAYLVGNPWPAIDPWRRIAAVLPTGVVEYPEEFGTWPAVFGLGALLWLELALPVLENPTLLAALVVTYTAYTLAGAVLFGRGPWFERADPISVWYRFYGAVGPLQRTTAGFELRPYGSRLRAGSSPQDADAVEHANSTDESVGGDGVVGSGSDVAFVLLLVWELTFSGFVATPAGNRLLEASDGAGLPSEIVYLLGIGVGFLVLRGAYRLATYRSRERAQTYLAPSFLSVRFASPLLAIAAGYHFTHYGGVFLRQLPALVDVAGDPFGAVDASVLVLPPWFGHVEAIALLAGHVLAVWVAHGTAVSTFPGRLQAIRSQYPYIVLMAVLTMASLWMLSQPVP